MKKFLFLALVLTITLMAAFLPSQTVYADGEIVISAKVLNYNQNTLYHIFNSPKDIFYASDGLYIVTADGCDIYTADIYNNGSISKNESLVADDITYLNGFITLNEGDIHYNGTSIEGTYKAISAYDNALYALDDNTIYKFNYIDGELVEDGIYVSPTLPIGRIAATEKGCAYTVQNLDNSTSIYVDKKEYSKSLNEEIIDLEYNGKIYALTHNTVFYYADKYEPVPFSKNNTQFSRFAVGDRVYVLTRTGNVERLTLDLAANTTIIAGSTDSNWFYSAPVNGSARLGKIYVADRNLGRVAIITGTEIEYITGLALPVAVVADNTGKVYVAHRDNHIACFVDGTMVDDKEMGENIIDLQVDVDNKLYALTEGGYVLEPSGRAIRSNVKAFDYQNGWHYLTDGYIDDNPIEDATDFCTDIVGSIFAVSGNTITAFVKGQVTTYTVENVAHINAITISKADTDLVSYGDIILYDDINKCVLTIDGDVVGSANVKDLYNTPFISSTPNDRAAGLIALAKDQIYMFTLPIEGEISYTISAGSHIIICREVSSPDPYVYCLCDDPDTRLLRSGYVYKSSLEILPYTTPKNAEAKVNADNTPIYKFPTIKGPVITPYPKNSLVSLLPFAVTFTDKYGDGWYTDAYGNMWYRIEYGEQEGYILAYDTNVNFYSDDPLPKTNATIKKDASLYRYDEASGKYVEFTAAGDYIAKGTRVVVDPPFDTSRPYTKIVFYRAGYGTIDIDCYVRTEYIKYDGVDIIKIVAIAVVVVAIIVLVIIIARKSKKTVRKARRPIDM
ncbi:MAG: hypothetical protein J1F36_05410 [Clostridiales bacterium]|nr:hypothetical protein [Clostridiales bacterium]